MLTNNLLEMKESEISAGESTRNACPVCQARARDGGSSLLRCVRCRSQWYCSRECQRKDWRKHKYICYQRSQQNAFEAWNELREIVMETSAGEAAAAFHRANDEIATLTASQEQEPQKNDVNNKQHTRASKSGAEVSEGTSAKTSCPSGKRIPTTQTADTVRKTRIVSVDSEDAAKETKEEEPTESSSEVAIEYSGENAMEDEISFSVRESVIQSDVAPQRQPVNAAVSLCESLPTEPKKDDRFAIYVEELAHLSCYQVDVWPKLCTDATSIDLQHWTAHVSYDETETSVVSLYNTHMKHNMSFRLMGYVSDSIGSASVQNGRLSIRLSYEAHDEQFMETRTSSIEIANQVCCSGCGSFLLMEPGESNARVDRVLPLPSVRHPLTSIT